MQGGESRRIYTQEEEEEGVVTLQPWLKSIFFSLQCLAFAAENYFLLL